MADGPAGLRITRVYNIDDKGHFHRLSMNPIFENTYIYFSRQKKISLARKPIKKDYSKYHNVVYHSATAIPIATAVAQSFNVDLAEKYGDIIGKEMELFNIQLLLAPAMNIHRNILCGRNFEYYSEDPLIAGKMAAAITKGVKSHKNTGTTLKHFAGNNQEINRFNNNAKMSERTLREIILKGYQIAIEESQPTAIMTSYNLINGIHTSQNKQLLIDVLRNEWNFKGLIMTDWIFSGRSEFKISKHPPQNIFYNIKGGMNIMMPGSRRDYNIIINKLKQKLLTREDLLQCASKVYETIELLNK
jgi:beta-glucosidase